MTDCPKYSSYSGQCEGCQNRACVRSGCMGRKYAAADRTALRATINQQFGETLRYLAGKEEALRPSGQPLAGPTAAPLSVDACSNVRRKRVAAAAKG